MNYPEFKALHEGLSDRQLVELLLAERTDLTEKIAKLAPEGDPITHADYRSALGETLLYLAQFIRKGDPDQWASSYGLLIGVYASLIDLEKGKSQTIFHRPKAKKGQARHERKMMAQELLCNIVAVQTGGRSATTPDLDVLKKRTGIPVKDFRAALKAFHGKVTHDLDLAPKNGNVNREHGEEKTIETYVKLYRLWKPTVE